MPKVKLSRGQIDWLIDLVIDEMARDDAQDRGSGFDNVFMQKTLNDLYKLRDEVTGKELRNEQ